MDRSAEAISAFIDAEVNRRTAEKLRELADSLNGSAAAHQALATIKTQRAQAAVPAPAQEPAADYAPRCTVLKANGAVCGGKIGPTTGECVRCAARDAARAKYQAEHAKKA